METKEKLKKILTEWRESKMPQLHARRFDLGLLKAKEILTIIGARRTGKTFLCYQLIELLSKTAKPFPGIILFT
jgi:predicted AAA+ superfamily ATPase